MELKLNNKRTYLVGLVFMSIILFWTIYDSVIAKMLVDNFGLNQTASGVVMALDNILALFLLPLFGRISDRTKSKMGKRTPFILIGTVIAAILLVGVSFFDLFQQLAVSQEGISQILKMDVDPNKDHFYYTLNGVPQIYSLVKSEVSIHRATQIFTLVTQTNPWLLIGFIVVLFLVLVAMGTYRSPAVSLMPDVTPKPLRSKANAIINLLGTIGGGISYITVFVFANEGGNMYKELGYIPAFVFTAILMLIIIAIFFVTVKETTWSKEMVEITKEYNLDSLEVDEEGTNVSQYSESEKMPKDVFISFILILSAIVLWFMGYNAATSKFSVYMTNHLHSPNYTIPPLIGTVTAAIAFIPIGMLSTKVGRRRMILIGIVILASALGLATFINQQTEVLIYIVMAMVGISWAAINVNSYPMVVEMSKHGNIGVYTGYYYTASMAAQIITPIISGAIMDITGYYPSLFIYSSFFVALSFIPMFFVKHGEPVKLEELNNSEYPIE